MLTGLRRSVVAVVLGFERLVRDSVARTDTLETVVCFCVKERDGATYYICFRLTPGDNRIAEINVRDAGVEAVT